MLELADYEVISGSRRDKRSKCWGWKMTGLKSKQAGRLGRG